MKGAVVLITGGASGIGRQFAVKLNGLGARVVATDINEGGLETLAAQNKGIVTLPHDVSDEGAWDRVVARLENDYKRIDCLFNNAGISVAGGLVAPP